MCSQTTAPADAYAPDADRQGPDAPPHYPEWLIYLLALLLHCMLESLVALGLRDPFAQQAWWHDRPDLPAGSTQAEAASIRGNFGTAIEWMCLRHGVGPGHPAWPDMSRAIVAFGGSLKRFRPGLPAFGLQWWENPNVVPGMGAGFGTPAATAVLLAREAAANPPPPASTPPAMPAEAAHGRLPASWTPALRLPASMRPVFARAGPGPPTGPPWLPKTANPYTSDARGQSMAGPAILIPAV